MKNVYLPLLLLLLGSLAMAETPKLPSTLTLHEDFGVSHPEQIVYFRPEPRLKPGQAALFDEQGEAGAFPGAAGTGGLRCAPDCRRERRSAGTGWLARPSKCRGSR